MQTSLIYKNTLALYKAYVASHATFNALSAIQNFLVNDEQRRALKNLSVFGKFLRRLSQSASPNLTNLEDEIELLKPYLFIEQIRFENRLRIDFKVPDDIDKATLPGLVLLAFAEEQLLKFTKSNIKNAEIQFQIETTENSIVFKSAFTPSIDDQENIKYSDEQQNRKDLFHERLELYNSEFNSTIVESNNSNTLTLNKRQK